MGNAKGRLLDAKRNPEDPLRRLRRYHHRVEYMGRFMEINQKMEDLYVIYNQNWPQIYKNTAEALATGLARTLAAERLLRQRLHQVPATECLGFLLGDTDLGAAQALVDRYLHKEPE